MDLPDLPEGPVTIMFTDTEASGGQILVSDVTRQLAGTVADVTFHDTGEHELKGFPEPWRLWEVVARVSRAPRDGSSTGRARSQYGRTPRPGNSTTDFAQL
jgi:hypothetical protein